MKYDQIEAIAAVLRDSPRLTEIEVRNPESGVSLRLRRAPARTSAVAAAPVPDASPTLLPLVTSNSAATPHAVSMLGEPATFSAVSEPKAAAATAGLVGVFRPVQNRPVAVGDAVRSGQVLGYIESMRLMNECSAPVTGVVSALLVSDGQPVEYGQPLFEVLPGSGNEEL